MITNIILSIISLILTIVGLLLTFTNLSFLKIVDQSISNKTFIAYHDFYESFNYIFVTLLLIIILFNVINLYVYLKNKDKIANIILFLVQVIFTLCLVLGLLSAKGPKAWSNDRPVITYYLEPASYILMMIFILSLIINLINLFICKNEFKCKKASFIQIDHTSSLFCSNCRTKLKNNFKFCPKCGKENKNYKND